MKTLQTMFLNTLLIKLLLPTNLTILTITLKIENKLKMTTHFLNDTF